jgi:plastocyanin
VAGSLDPTTCTESIEPTVVTVTIEDFAFVPPTVEAEAGEVITFTNTGFESHNATLDNGACKTPTLETGGRAGLLFSTTGSFPFHCSVHTWMKGTIVIAAAAARGTLDPEVVPRTGAAGGPRRSGDLDGEQRGA